MFAHLIGPTPDVFPYEGKHEDFTPVEKVKTDALLRAQLETSSWLTELGAPTDQEVAADFQKAEARQAFAALATGEPDARQKQSLLKIRSPHAMQHLGAMLEAHDWEFVQHAKELRSMVVTKVLKETDHPDARIRLRALEMIGKITEVSLFTDRVEVTKVDLGDAELEQRIRQRLEKFMIQGEVTDVTPGKPNEPHPKALPTPAETDDGS